MTGFDCAGLNNDDDGVGSSSPNVLCDSKATRLISGTAYCVPHGIAAIRRVEHDKGIGGLMRSLDTITLADIEAIRDRLAPLMGAFAGGGLVAPPGMCTLTPGCLDTAGHDDVCTPSRGN